MKYIVTVFLAFMTISLVISGILLWRRRKETGDYSRTIWSVLSWFSAFFTMIFIMRTWLETTTADRAFTPIGFSLHISSFGPHSSFLWHGMN